VGVEVRRDQGAVVIDMVYEPSDATVVGVRPGDVVEAVDGAPLSPLDLDEVRLLLRGTPGETRTLDVQRDGTGLSFTVAVDRLLPPR